MHRREAVVSAALPRVAALSRGSLDAYDDGDWVALAFDAVDGRPPRHPWEAGELGRGHRRARRPARRPHPEPPAVARHRWPTTRRNCSAAGRSWPPWTRRPAGLDPWARAHLDRLAELESGWPAACEGPTLVHGDVRADNVLLAGDGVVFVDWPHAAVGTPVFDVSPGRPRSCSRAARRPRSCWPATVAPVRVDPDVITVLLAAVGGFFVAHSLRPPPPGCRPCGRSRPPRATVALAWLRRRTGW